MEEKNCKKIAEKAKTSREVEIKQKIIPMRKLFKCPLMLIKRLRIEFNLIILAPHEI